MTERFVSEAIKPVGQALDTAAMATGEPGFPSHFSWRGRTFEVQEVLEQWKDTGSCRHGSGEQYVRKHWFKLRTDHGEIMKIYFERQAASKRQRKQRWWLFTVEETDEGES